MRFSFAPVQSLPRFNEMIMQAKLAEDLGYHGLWAHEHHSEGTMYPCPLVTCSIMAGVTDHIKIGTNMLLLPLYHPVRVAEEGAMVDAQSGGRLRIGMSAGYSDTDLGSYNINPRDRGKIMEEGIRLIKTLWSEENIYLDERFSHLRNYTLFPKPAQNSGPPIYLGATIDKAIRRAARLADEFLVSATQRIVDIPRVTGIYKDELISLGKDSLDKCTTINRIVCVVENAFEKDRALKFFGEIFLKLYMKWGHSNVTELDTGLRELQKLASDHFIIGEPEECIDLVSRYRELDIGEIACLMNYGGPELEIVEKSMRLFAGKVMPKFT